MDKPTSLEEKWAAEAAEPELIVDAEDGNNGDDSDAGVTADATEAERQVAELTDQLRRQQAEMANFRRRTERDREEQIAEARRQLLRDLLPVLDDFERSLDAETDNLDAYREGVELILKSLHDFMNGAGVERIDPHGDPFDPHLHQAVEHSETDEVPEHHIATVYQPGYSHAGRLLRPAMVGVARPPAAADDADSSDSDA
ncbi:MAG: nucleotide exchange factor GrpE [Acidobacteria bacterium]|nr:nucleotide exchange factor GrpE [Acidobacteriota bacterium]